MKRAQMNKERDKQIILGTVRQLGTFTRVEIHQLTHMRPTTISLLVRELLEERRLKEVGTSNNPMGRKQILLQVNESYGSILGIEMDSEEIVAAVTDFAPRILIKVSEPSILDKGKEALVAQIIQCAHHALQQAGLTPDSLRAVAFANPGLVDSREGIALVSSLIDFWKEVPLRRIFEEEFKVPFFLENDTRARALAERRLGAGEMAEDMLYIDYRDGIGVGVFNEGRLLRGHTESAGEFGHTHIMLNGPVCKCGSFGCLEAIAGIPSLGHRARAAISDGSQSKALSLAGELSRITGWTVLEAARAGDKLCSALIEELGDYLGLGIANLVNLFNPAVVVLSSSLEKAGPELLERIKRVVKIQSFAHSVAPLVFRYGTLGAESGVLGGALVALEEMFRVPVMRTPKFLLQSAGTSRFHNWTPPENKPSTGSQ